jgi:hypothetical protein
VGNYPGGFRGSGDIPVESVSTGQHGRNHPANDLCSAADSPLVELGGAFLLVKSLTNWLNN